MAIYRQVHVNFWQDELMAELSPEDKYFYLYLMTNNKTTQCGVYRINPRVAAFDLGWDKTTVEKLIERFIEKGRIRFNSEHQEIMMLNWLKFNNAKSPKVARCIDKELLGIKTEAFRQAIIQKCKELKYPIHTVSIQYANTMDTEPQEEQEEEQEKEQEEEQEMVSSLIKFMEQNGYGLVTTYVIEELQYLVTDYEPKLIEQAIKIGIENNVRKLNYVKKVLSNWETEGITSLAAYQAKKQVKPQEANNFLSFVNGG